MIERHHFRPRQSACVPGKPTSLRSFVKQCSIISILGCLGQQPASSSGTFSHCSGGALVACDRRFIMASNSVCPVADSFGRCLGGCSCSCSSTGLVLSSVWGKAANEHKELVITLLVLAFRSLMATGRSAVTSLKRLIEHAIVGANLAADLNASSWFLSNDELGGFRYLSAMSKKSLEVPQ